MDKITLADDISDLPAPLMGRLPTDTWTLRGVIETQNLISNAGLSVDEIMSTVVVRAQALTASTGAVVELAEGEEMVYAAATGTCAESVGLRLSVHTSLSGLSVQTARILVCRDTETDPRVDRDACRRVGARSMVVAPLLHQGQASGVIKVLSDQPDAFDDHAVGILELLAGFVGAALTHARTFEQNHAHLAELDRLNQALEAFSAHVAHDLKGPMAGIAMALDQIERDPDGPETHLLLGVARRQAGKADRLIRDLLSLARASRRPRYEPVDLAILTADAADAPGEGEVRFVGPVQSVVADVTAVNQAITNLVANARQYATEGADTAVEVGCEGAPGGWRVTVSDRGRGLSDEQRRSVFEPFDRGAQTDRQGTGLGLAIVAATARAHGGVAGCDAREGGGSVFWFTLRRP